MKQINKSCQQVATCLFLVASALIVYWNVGSYEFINFDDNLYVWNNRYVKQGLTLENIGWAFRLSGDSEEQAYWHPLTWISHMVDCQLFGLDAGKHHLVSLSIHIMNAILLYLIFYLMTGAAWRSAFAAALFAVHPLNVDSVAWVAERKNLLSTFFWFMTMLAYVHYSRRPSVSRYILVFVAMTAGLLAKPMLVTLPCVLLLLDFWPLGRLRLAFLGEETAAASPFHPSSPGRLIAEKIPLLALSFFSILASVFSLQSQNQIVPGQVSPMPLRIENAIVSYVKYLAKILWPDNMAIYYPFPEAIPLWQVMGSLVLLSMAFWVVFHFRRQTPYLAVGWLWFVGTLTPVIGIIQGGLWPEIADRWTYIPAIGIFIMISWGGVAVFKRYSIKPAIAALAALSALIPLAFIAKNQTSHWQNSVALFSHALQVSKSNAVAHYNLAEGLAKSRQFDQAIPHYHEALKIDPKLAKAHNNLGNLLAEKKELDQAFQHFYKALEIDPKLVEAHINLGKALSETGDFKNALGHFKQALELDPNRPETHEAMGKALARQKLFDAAIEHFQKALKLNTQSADALNGLGNVLAEKGDLDEAIKVFNQLLIIDPDYLEAHNNLGNALVRKGNLAEALYHYETIISEGREVPVTIKNRDALLSFLKPNEQVNLLFKTAVRFAGDKNYENALVLFKKITTMTPDNPAVYYNISCLYALQGRKAEAVDWLRQAVEHGYDNWERLKTDPDMNNIKNEPYFRELMETKS